MCLGKIVCVSLDEKVAQYTVDKYSASAIHWQVNGEQWWNKTISCFSVVFLVC